MYSAGQCSGSLHPGCWELERWGMNGRPEVNHLSRNLCDVRTCYQSSVTSASTPSAIVSIIALVNTLARGCGDKRLLTAECFPHLLNLP